MNPEHEEIHMIEAMNRIAAAQEDQTKEWRVVKEELADIKESIRRIHDKLDETATKTTVNTEAVKNLKECCKEEKKAVDKQINIIHESIRRRDTVLRWIASTIIVPLIASLYAIFK